MRWKDDDGTRWRLRRQRLAWRRWVKPEVAYDVLPGGIGQDPISMILAIPCFVVLAVLLPFWLVEFAARLLATPVVVVLRLAGVVPYRLDLFRRGELVGTYEPLGHHEMTRLRDRLAAERRHSSRLSADVSGSV
jgi:hypothetical protein